LQILFKKYAFTTKRSNAESSKEKLASFLELLSKSMYMWALVGSSNFDLKADVSLGKKHKGAI
jgi:hypothetical protein